MAGQQKVKVLQGHMSQSGAARQRPGLGLGTDGCACLPASACLCLLVAAKLLRARLSGQAGGPVGMDGWVPWKLVERERGMCLQAGSTWLQLASGVDSRRTAPSLHLVYTTNAGCPERASELRGRGG